MKPFADCPYANAAVAAALTLGAAVVGCTLANEAHGQTLGVHVTTAHIKDRSAPPAAQPQSFTPGIYLLTEGKQSFGVVRNSYGRTSVYAAQSWQWGPFDFTLGVITGYDKRRIYGQGACTAGRRHTEWCPCWWDVGQSNAFLRPLAAVSLPVHIDYRNAIRLSLLGSGLHLSFERRLP